MSIKTNPLPHIESGVDTEVYTYYPGCDGWTNNIPEYHNGLDKDVSFDEVLKIARQHNCQIITKNGTGKWYIKAKQENNVYHTVKTKLDNLLIERKEKDIRNHCYLLHYDNKDTKKEYKEKYEKEYEKPISKHIPNHIVVCVSTSASKDDYIKEIKYFKNGGARWSGTKAGNEQIGDRFGFVDYKNNNLEVFVILYIKSGDEKLQYVRSHWNREWPRVLILSKKLGDIKYDKMYTEFNKYSKSPQSVSYWEWNENLENNLTSSIVYIPREIDIHNNGYVYFLYSKMDPGHSKVGYSNAPISRLKTLQCGNRLPLEIYKTIPCINYKKLELYMHKYLSNRRSTIGGGTEWFKISLSEIDDIIKYMN
jgi:hypothetical protein